MSKYFNKSDMQLAIYLQENAPVFTKLPTKVQVLFKKFMKDYTLYRLKKYHHYKESNYVFDGVSDIWLSDIKSLKYKVSGKYYTYDNLLQIMPDSTTFIYNAVSSVISELSYVAYLYLTDNSKQFIEDNMKEVSLVLSDEDTSIEMDYCRKFYALGLAVPPILLTEYKRVYKRVVLSGKCVQFYAQIGENYEQYKGTPVEILHTIHKKILDERLDISDKEMALLAKAIRDAYGVCVLNGYEEVDMLIGAAKRKIYKTHGANGLRLATVREIQGKVPQLAEEDELLIKEGNFNKLLIFVYLCTGSEWVLKHFVGDGLEKLLALDEKGMIREATEYINSVEFIEDLEELKSTKEIKYPSKAADEILDNPMRDKMKKIVEILGKKAYPSEYEATVLDIAKKGLAGKELSTKQLALVRSMFESMKTWGNKENLYTKEVEEKILACRKYFNYSNNKVVTSIFDSILKFKSCSKKQLGVVESECLKMAKAKESAAKLASESEVETKPVAKSTGRGTKQATGRGKSAVSTKKGKETESNKNKGTEASKTSDKKKKKEELETITFGDYKFEEVDV